MIQDVLICDCKEKEHTISYGTKKNPPEFEENNLDKCLDCGKNLKLKERINGTD